MSINVVGKKVLTTSGGTQTLQIQDPLCGEYFVSFKLISGTPAAGTTAVAVTPFDGTSESLLDTFGVAVNVDPTALKAFKVSNPISSMSFTPSNWTAGVDILATVMAESSIVYQDRG